MEKTSIVLSFGLLVLLFAAPVQPEQGATTAATTIVTPTTRIPQSTQEIPASPVSYDFAGDEGENVCLILTPQTTAVISACSSNADLKFSTNLSPSVPINLVQTRDASTMCQLLIITTSIDNLQEGAFDVFYDSSSLQIRYGPLRFSNPNGGHVLSFDNGITEVVLRYRPVDRTRVEFQVCRNGTLANFVVTLRQPSDCRLGTGAGGFSSHFDAIVSDIGQDPLSGENFTISSGPCNNTAAGISYNFSVPEKVFSSTIIIPSTPSLTPSLTPSPTFTIISTVPSPLNSIAVTSDFTAPSIPTSPIPTPGRSNTIVIAVIAVTAAIIVALGIGMAIFLAIICIFFIRRRTHGRSDQVDGNGELPNRKASPVLKQLNERVDKISTKVEDNSFKVEENITKIEETNVKVEENSTKIEETNVKVAENSTKIERTNFKVAENSTKIEETNVKVAENSTKIEGTNFKLEETCKKVEENSTKIVGNSVKVAQTSVQVEENTETVGDLQKELEQEKLKAVNIQQRLDEHEDTELENNLSEQQDQETEVEDHRGSNHTH